MERLEGIPEHWIHWFLVAVGIFVCASALLSADWIYEDDAVRPWTKYIGKRGSRILVFVGGLLILALGLFSLLGWY